MPKASGVDGIAVAATAAGALFLWSGFSGKGLLASVQGLIKGIAPASVPATNTITPVPLTGTPGTTTGAATGGGNSAIAADAERYIGAGYVFGGAPAHGVGNWDCSSFVNWVIGHDLGLAIPGIAAGKYTGTSHGPTALMWSLWSGATTIGTDGNQAQPGDLCCWQTHIGIAVGGGQMISARSARDNPPTGKNTINGDIKGEHLTIRRLRAA